MPTTEIDFCAEIKHEVAWIVAHSAHEYRVPGTDVVALLAAPTL